VKNSFYIRLVMADLYHCEIICCKGFCLVSHEQHLKKNWLIWGLLHNLCQILSMAWRNQLPVSCDLLAIMLLIQ
jgi:hypothetical protein